MNSRLDNDPVRRLLLPRKRPPGTAGRYAERLPLPAALAGTDAVPLHAALAAARSVLSTVDGLAVSGEQLTITHRQPPTDADRQRLHDLLADPARLRAAAAPAVAAALPEGTDLLARLRDDTIPDAEWLRQFRRWATTGLLAGNGTG